jgi:hypothetical protein
MAMDAVEARNWLTSNFPLFVEALDGLTGSQMVTLTEAQIANSFEQGKPKPKPAMISVFYNHLQKESM